MVKQITHVRHRTDARKQYTVLLLHQKALHHKFISNLGHFHDLHWSNSPCNAGIRWFITFLRLLSLTITDFWCLFNAFYLASWEHPLWNILYVSMVYRFLAATLINNTIICFYFCAFCTWLNQWSKVSTLLKIVGRRKFSSDQSSGRLFCENMPERAR